MIRSILVAITLLTAFILGAPEEASAEEREDKTSVEIEQLEKKFFQHDYPKDSEEHRLARLEKFTFGEVQKGQAQARIAQIQGALHTDLPQEAPRSSLAMNPAPVRTPGNLSDRLAARRNDGSLTKYPHITFLESEILGATHEDEPVEERLARMEVKAFGAQSGLVDLSSRTDNLEQFAEVRLNKSPFAMQPETKEHFGRYNLPPRIAFSDIPSPEEIAARSSIPPDSHARTIARIAWCEQHTFGKTYPEMHLLERLHQLNSRLFPQDHEKDIQLMDRIDEIVKKVVMLQHPPQAST